MKLHASLMAFAPHKLFVYAIRVRSTSSSKNNDRYTCPIVVDKPVCKFCGVLQIRKKRTAHPFVSQQSVCVCRMMKSYFGTVQIISKFCTNILITDRKHSFLTDTTDFNYQQMLIRLTQKNDENNLSWTLCCCSSYRYFISKQFRGSQLELSYNHSNTP